MADLLEMMLPYSRRVADEARAETTRHTAALTVCSQSRRHGDTCAQTLELLRMLGLVET